MIESTNANSKTSMMDFVNIEKTPSWYLLFAIPFSAIFVFYLHVQTVDLEWLYMTGLSKKYGISNSIELAGHLAAKENLWHFAKQGFWPLVLLLADTMLIGLLCMIFGQIFGVKTKLRSLFMIGVFSKATYLITALIITIRIALSPSPTHILTINLDPLSWNNILGLTDDTPLQFFTSNQGPIAFLGVAILAFCFRQMTQRGWIQSFSFAFITYGLNLGMQYYLFGVFF